MSLAAIGGLLAWTERGWPRRALLVAATLPIAIVMNGLRIAATGLACEAALELARNAAARLPGDADVHDTLGWVAFKAGRLSLAASELERAVALNKREPSYTSHLQDGRAEIAAEAAAEAAAAKKRTASSAGL